MYRKSAASTLEEWKMRFLHLTTSYRLTIGHIHDKLSIVAPNIDESNGCNKRHLK